MKTADEEEVKFAKKEAKNEAMAPSKPKEKKSEEKKPEEKKPAEVKPPVDNKQKKNIIAQTKNNQTIVAVPAPVQ